MKNVTGRSTIYHQCIWHKKIGIAPNKVLHASFVTDKKIHALNETESHAVFCYEWFCRYFFTWRAVLFKICGCIRLTVVIPFSKYQSTVTCFDFWTLTVFTILFFLLNNKKSTMQRIGLSRREIRDETYWFQILKKLSEGSYGKVFVALDRQNQKKYIFTPLNI